MRYWVLMIFVASALYAHFRGKVRFRLARALTDFTVLIAPVNALMYLFSRAPATPYLDPQQFKELELLQQNWQVIREEALKLNDEGQIKAASTYNDIGFNSFFRTGWKRFYLKWYGEDLASAKALCPKTVELLRQIPTVKAAMFASLPPGSRLVRHRDPYAGSVRYHLGLTTPNSPGCFIEVDGQRYHWKDGEAVMFDETFIHYAENTTEQQRVILFCDVERPLYFAPVRWFNRLFARVVMTASATQNVEGEPVGALNKFFFYAYKVRLWGKALKAKSRPTYYIGKWAIIVGLFYWVFVS
ncbi:aspartyl/asparaginyl beta-hydroxylase domain-containing protein [Roseateles sp. DAIF2]|uniref:aspartyl/asparaginyl beta-hydroxylase domain-containing protein n=1 Tax=Roseateles sp. DAIF2 TaxID=2714952 RepID=UPI001BC954D5|nr:aspartyl/asparaginyl beta-hydroxylase domain-containing protein [Roseateles sp. DAIF2]